MSAAKSRVLGPEPDNAWNRSYAAHLVYHLVYKDRRNNAVWPDIRTEFQPADNADTAHPPSFSPPTSMMLTKSSSRECIRNAV